MPFEFIKQELDGLILIEPKVFPDNRGLFMETYKKSDFTDNGIEYDFIQDNHSVSRKGVIRGLHYQLAPKSQGKLVRVLRGKVWDVAVDIRKSSPTYLKWMAFELSEENKKMLFIPPWFAHGFLALTDNAHLVYKCTEEYDTGMDAGIRYDDPYISIAWPENRPVVSDKDMKLPFVKNARIFD